MKNSIAVMLTGCLLLVASNAFSADVAAGKLKSSACVSCHGLNGISSLGSNPNLAGQKEVYLVKAIKAYRDGKRKDAMMGSFVGGLSDVDIENLAAYYSSLKP